MAQRVIIPRMGQTMTEGTVAKFYVSDGDTVNAGDNIYELEYDKSSASIEAKVKGVVKLLCKEGDVVPLGQAVAVILENGETLDSVDIKGAHAVANAADAKKEAPKAAPAAVAAASAPAPKKADRDADIIVIGGGPGGYVAAIKAAMLGAKVILAEKDTVGGTCLNRGCIPTKAILQCSEVFHQTKNSEAMGITVEGAKIDTVKADAYKDKVVKTLVRGVEGLIKARKIKLVKGVAGFVDKNTVSVKAPDGREESFTAENIIIAAGSKPSRVPIPGIDGKNVITSTEALDIKTLPGSMVIIGGGVIGMEIGAAYSNLGVKITVIEALDRILPNMDGEVSAEYTKRAKKLMDINTSARVEGISDKDGKKLVRYNKNGASAEVEAETVLVCIGRAPDTDELRLEKAGIASERGRVIVDDNYRTSVDGIYCIGDANGKCMLAHAASAQGIFVAELLTGHKCGINLDIVPSCIYTDPEIASVGMTEEAAKEAGIDYKTGRFSFRANGRSLVLGKAEGFVKIIGGAKYGEVLGVHIIGPYATELIASCAVAMKLEACVEDIANTIHAHPTVSESIMEAAESFLGGAVHSL